MAYLFLYLAVTVAGYFIGSKLKKRGIDTSRVGTLQTVVIVVLVFLMGSRIGANQEIVSSLDSIGLVSLIYTLIILAVTCAFASIARRLLGFDRYGVRRIRRSGTDGGSLGLPAQDAPADPEGAEASRTQRNGSGEELPADALPRAGQEPTDGSRVNHLTLLIVVFVAIGILAGYFVLPEGFLARTGDLLTVTLCLLLILIGIDIGTDGTMVQNFRSAGWRVLVFPFVSMFAMMIGSVIASLVLPMSVQDSLCTGSGFAWYSLAPAMLAEYSTRISAISFMHNVFREILGMLLVPVVARRIGYIECYGLPGSTSMDVCLPVIERATSGDVAVYSFISGVIMSASVPVLVSLFMNL